MRTALGRDLELPILFHTVVESIAGIFGYSHVSSYLLQADVLVLQHQVGYDQEFVIAQIPITRGISGGVVRSGQSVLLEDVRTDPTFLAAGEGITSEICVPLFDQGHVAGTLNVESTGGMKLSDADLQLMLAVSQYVGIAIERARLYTQLRESEKRFRALIEYSYDGLTLLDPKGNIIYYSPSNERITGYTSEERMGQTGLAFVHPDDHERVTSGLREMAQNPGGVNTGVYRIRHKNGSWRWVEGIARNLLAEPSVQAIVMNVRDVTERARAEEELRASEERFRSLSQAAFEGIMIHEEGVILDANAAFANLFGYPDVKDLIGKNGLEILSFSPESREKIRQVMPLNSSQTYEIQVVRPDGTTLPAETQGREIIYRGRRARVVAMRDITERKRAEEALRESEARLTSVIASAMDAIIATDADQRIVLFNGAAERMFRCSAANVIGQPLDRFIPERHRATHQMHVRKFCETGVTSRTMDKPMPLSGVRADGEEFPIEASISRIVGGHTLYMVILRDITERQQAEEALQASEARFRALIENSRDVILVLDPDGVIRYAGPSVKRIMGYALDAFMGHNAFEFIHPEEMARLTQAWRRVPQDLNITPGVIETRIRHADGSWHVHEGIGTNLFDNPAVKGFVLNSRDITERKRAEEALRGSEEQYRTLVETSPDAIALIALDGKILACNQRAVEIWDYDSITDVLSTDAFSLIAPPDRERARRDLGRGLQGFDNREMQYTFLKKDGTRFIGELSASLLRDLNGAPKSFIAITRDITDRKRAEEEIHQLNADLERRVAERTRDLAEANERLTELDRLKSKFVSDVSHELRTPIATVKLYIDLLEQGRPEKRAEYVAVLHQQIRRVAALVDDILDLSRLERRKQGGVIFEAVDLNDVVAQMVTAHQPRAEAAGLTLTFVSGPHLPLVRGDANQLAQVITNLVANALNYTPQGQVRVSTWRRGDQVCLQVADTGNGIAADDLPHIFERFYRGQRVSKTDVPGTGLGLAITKEIVDLHHGRIEVESRVSEGTTFRVWLPVEQEV